MFFAIAFHHTNEWESENKNTKYKTLLIQNTKTLIQHLIYVNINNVNLQLIIIISSIQLINFHFFALINLNFSHSYQFLFLTKGYLLVCPCPFINIQQYSFGFVYSIIFFDSGSLITSIFWRFIMILFDAGYFYHINILALS